MTSYLGIRYKGIVLEFLRTNPYGIHEVSSWSVQTAIVDLVKEGVLTKDGEYWKLKI